MNNIERIWQELISGNIPVCDQWKSYDIFKTDFISLLGYDSYIKSNHPEKFRLEIAQADKTWGILYSPKTAYLTDTKLDNTSGESHFVGVQYDTDRQLYVATLQYNNENYCLGYYTLEIAAAAAYNYIASQLMGCQINRLHVDLKPEDWIVYKEPSSIIEIPYDLMIPSHIMQLCGMKKKTGSIYNGVYMVSPNTYRAYYQDFEGNIIILGEYNSEIVAASAYEYYCKKHGFGSGNIIPYLIPEEQLARYSYSPSKATDNLQIGSIHTSLSGERYEIVSIENKNLNEVCPSTPVFVKFLNTGNTTIITARNIKNGTVRDIDAVLSVQSIASIKRSFPKDKLTIKIYYIWYRMIQRVLSSHPKNPLEILDERWLVFDNFLEDIWKLEGSYLLHGKYAKFCNTKHQMDLAPEQRCYNPHVCYISTRIIEEKYQFIADHKEGEYIGVQPLGNHWIFEISRTPYSNKRIRQVYSNFIAAVNAYNYYYQYYFGVTPNQDVPYMSHDEFIKFRITKGPIQQLYHLV